MSEPTSEIPTTIDPDLEAGARVGEYQVESKLGQGAFGTVFKATHPLIGKVVAIKVLARKFSVDPEMVSRFTAEARAVNQIRNRHIIDIFSFGTLDDGRQYYVMEYLDGEPLDALLERGRIPVADTLQILRGVARALDAAHAKGVAHRDLKAENIFLANDPDGSVTGYWPKLLDFGIAKLMAPEDGLKHKTRTGAPIGTPYYMSPEQCRGKDVDHRTDIYAFGVLAYLMLTGVYPFDADDYMSILMKQITERQTAPSTHNAELSPEIDDAVAWMMNKDPADRPPDLRTAVRALEQAAVAAGLATASQWEAQTGPVAIPTQAINVASAVGRISSKSGNPVDISVPAKRSRRAAWIAGGLAMALVAGVAIVLATRGDGERAAPPRETPHQVAPPAPTPAPAPSPPPPPATAEVPQTVIVTIVGVPEGTEVFAGGMTVGAAPGPVQLPRDSSTMVLTFKADGYLTASREVTPDKDQSLDVTLKKKPAAKRKTKDDILDPFGRK
ncbi:MAG: serine/threonine protein kinase [Kofleriaceae bacterium]